MADYIKAIREQKAWEVPKKKSGTAGFIAGTIGAFTAGLLLVLGLDGLPFLKAKLAPPTLSTASESVATTPVKEADAHAVAAVPVTARPEPVIPADNRLGKPETSPLLLRCYAELTGGEGTGKMKPADVYRLMKMAGQLSRFAAVANIKQQAIDAELMAYGWGLMTDCIFKQNSWAMCEPRNRALAVESIRTFVRQHKVALAEQRTPPPTAKRNQPSSGLNPHYVRQMLNSLHERTMASFHHLLEDGIIIAADFGYFPPSELSATLSTVKPTRNACAGR